MPIVVHLRNGQVEELRAAQSCSWSPAQSKKDRADAAPRWLVCRNDRGEVIATFEEPDIVGYQSKPSAEIKRFELPSWRKSAHS